MEFGVGSRKERAGIAAYRLPAPNVSVEANLRAVMRPYVFCK